MEDEGVGVGRRTEDEGVGRRQSYFYPCCYTYRCVGYVTFELQLFVYMHMVAAAVLLVVLRTLVCVHFCQLH